MNRHVAPSLPSADLGVLMSSVTIAEEVSIASGVRSSSLDRPSTIRTGDLVVDLDSRLVSVHGMPVRLTGKEYSILELLSLRQGTTVTKEMLLSHLYRGMDEPEMKIIDVFVCKLRQKLAQPTGSKFYIETVWGRGYRLRAPAPVSSATLVVGAEDFGGAALNDKASSRAA